MMEKLGGPKRVVGIVLVVLLTVAMGASAWFIFLGDSGDGGDALADGEFPILEFESPGAEDFPAAAPLPDPGAAALPPPPVAPPPAAVQPGYPVVPGAPAAPGPPGAVVPAPGAVYDPGPAATIAALQAQVSALQAAPTEEPAEPLDPEAFPTPDVAELVRAAVEEDRAAGGVSPVLQISPLDRNRSGRNPYLNAYEMDYFEAMGQHFWHYAKAWLILRNIMVLDVESWTPQLLAFELEALKNQLAPVQGREITPDSQVSELVFTYGEQLQEGFVKIDESVEKLESALVTAVQAGGEPLTDSQRTSLYALRREILNNMEEYNRVMSSYGCSVCGELFRQSR